MATTITSGASTLSPTVVDGYEANREAQTIVHVIPGSATPDVILRPALLRSGTLTCMWHGASSEANSKTAADLLATAATFALVSTDRTSIPMPFVVTGTVTRRLEDQSRDAWIVSFGFQETA